MWATNKKKYFSGFFFFARVLWFLRNDPSKPLLLLPAVSHFPSNYVYLIREKESQYHLVVIIERNVVVIYVLHLYCLGEQMKSKEVATELIV